MTKRLLLCLSFTLLAAAGCSKDEDKDKKPSKHLPGVRIQAAATLKVTDLNGRPLKEAQVLIGTEKNKPFADNFITTSAEGTFEAPEDWTTELPVTIQAYGYIRTTFFAQTPNAQTFRVRPLEGKGNFELSGETTGFQVRNNDGWVDYGMTFPAMERRDLFSFDVGMVVSPQNDEISIIGQKVKIPSNITLPWQKESYFLPITLNKPNYRMYFRTTGPKKVMTLHGVFPLKQVVDGVRGGADITSLINLFVIQGGSLKNVNLTGNNKVNLPVNEMVFSNTRRVNAPEFSDDQIMMSVAMSETSSGYLYPTDVKNLTSRGALDLKLGSGSNQLLTVLKKKSETQKDNLKDRLSATFLPFANGMRPTLLPMIDDPRLLSNTHIQIPAARTVGDVKAIATYATLWRLGTRGDATELTTVWEAFAPNWVREVRLPAWPSTSAEDAEMETAGRMRWGVTLVGQSSKVPGGGELGPEILENSTHATHSSVDF